MPAKGTKQPYRTFGSCRNHYRNCHNMIAGGLKKTYCSPACSTQYRNRVQSPPHKGCELCGQLFASQDAKSWHCSSCKPWVAARTRQARVIMEHAGHDDIRIVLWQLWQYKDAESCEVCGRPFDEGPRGRYVRHIDHCHKTGRIRGALCGSCNVIIGYAEENWAKLSLLINYLIHQEERTRQYIRVTAE